MGQKTSPVNLRMQVKDSPFKWKSRWFADKSSYKEYVAEDQKIREYLENKLEYAGLVSTQIKRLKNMVKIVIQASRPGVVIGRGGSGLRQIKDKLKTIIDIPEPENNIDIEVEEVKSASLSAKLVAEKIARQLERGMRYRRVVNQAMDKAMHEGAEGIKVTLSGRISGVEVSRVEKFSRGKVPLSTIRANIDYFHCPSLTRSGYVGVKVYINRGEQV
jgi:small subunit ribosomal protein S3